MQSPDEEILRIRELLKDNPKGLTISEIAKMASLNRISAARYLDRLLFSGRAEMRKFGHANVYTLASRIPLSQILDLFSSPVVIVGSDLFIRHANDRLLEIFRLAREDLVGHQLQYVSWYELFPATFLPLVRSALNGTPGRLEYNTILRGRPCFFDVNLKPVTDETGQICAAIILEDTSHLRRYEQDLEKMVSSRTAVLSKEIDTLALEIENQKDAKEALKASHHKYRSLVEDMPAYVCCFENDGTITFANENFCRFLDKERSDIVGSSLFTLTSHDKLALLPETFKKLNSDHPSTTLTKSTEDRDGKLTWQQWTCRALFNKAGRVCEYQSIGIDITNLVRAEQAVADYEKTLDAIVRGSPVPEFGIDKCHSVVFWNTAMETLTKIPASVMIGKKISGQFIYHRDHPLLADLIVDEKFDEIPKIYPTNCQQSAQVDETWEGIDYFRIHGSEGTWIYFTASAIRDTDGRITHAVETLLDLMKYKTDDGKAFFLDPEKASS